MHPGFAKIVLKLGQNIVVCELIYLKHSSLSWFVNLYIFFSVFGLKFFLLRDGVKTIYAQIMDISITFRRHLLPQIILMP